MHYSAWYDPSHTSPAPTSGTLAQRFLHEVAVLALDKVREDLRARGLKATLETITVEAGAGGGKY